MACQAWRCRRCQQPCRARLHRTGHGPACTSRCRLCSESASLADPPQCVGKTMLQQPCTLPCRSAPQGSCHWPAAPPWPARAGSVVLAMACQPLQGSVSSLAGHYTEQCLLRLCCQAQGMQPPGRPATLHTHDLAAAAMHRPVQKCPAPLMSLASSAALAMPGQWCPTGQRQQPCRALLYMTVRGSACAFMCRVRHQERAPHMAAMQGVLSTAGQGCRVRCAPCAGPAADPGVAAVWHRHHSNRLGRTSRAALQAVHVLHSTALLSTALGRWDRSRRCSASSDSEPGQCSCAVQLCLRAHRWCAASSLGPCPVSMAGLHLPLLSAHALRPDGCAATP